MATARLRLVSSILGRGAGAETRVALGTAVLSGMIGVTLRGIFSRVFTTVFSAIFAWFSDRRLLDRPRVGAVPSKHA